MFEDKETYLGKWLNNDLTAQELLQFEKSEEFDDYHKIIKGLEYFHAPSFDEDTSLAVTLEKLQHQKKGKVIRIKPFWIIIDLQSFLLVRK